MSGRWCVRLLVLICLASCSAPRQRAAASSDVKPPVGRVPKLVFGIQNVGGAETMRAWGAFAAHVEKAMHVRVDLRMAETYTELPALFRSGAIDIAELAPVVYAQARGEDPSARALVTPVISGSPTYIGHFYVRRDMPWQTVEDVRGKRIGYVSAVSSSGYLFPRDLLRQDGFDPNTFFGSSRFYQTHDQVLAAVVAGEVDVGAAIDMSLDWSGLTTPADSLKVIGKSRRIPHDCVVARGNFDEETALAFRDTLLAMRASDPEMKSILPGLHVNGWVRADEARYDVVREVMEREAQAASRN